MLLSGTVAGQARLCTAYVGATKVATVVPNWTTNPDATSVFATMPLGIADLEAWLASVPNALIGGRTDSNAQVIANAAISSSTFAAGAIDAAAIAANAIGASEIADGAIDAATFAAGAVNAAAIATDAIDADALAADAVTEIWAKACTEPTAVVAAAPTAIAALSWILTLSRNTILQTSTTQTLKADDTTTTIATSTHSDDGVTHTRCSAPSARRRRLRTANHVRHGTHDCRGHC